MKYLLLCILLLPGLVRAGEDLVLEGHTYGPTRQVSDQNLERVGVALFKYKRLFKLNTAGLYLEKADDAKRILSGEVPYRLELNYCRALKKEVFVDTAANYLAKNLNEDELAAIAAPLKQINTLFQPVEKNDQYSLTYLPGKGTTLALNQKDLGTMPGAAFAKGYITIWLGDKSIGNDFTDELLGR